MGTNPLKHVLAIGIRGLANWSPKEAETLLRSESEKGIKAGLALEVFHVQPDQPEKTTLDEFENILRKQKWEGVAFGYGVRGNRDLTPLFEKMINITVQQIQPAPQLAFPTSPDGIVEALQRVVSSSGG